MKSDTRIERMHHLSNRINRAKHTASLLLLLVGVLAVTGQTAVSTTQTSIGASIPGDLNARRSGHTATLLTTGKIVIVGGILFNFFPEAVFDAELFDPNTGTWSVTGTSLHSGRVYHTATLLRDGTVLIAAGDQEGGLATPLNSAELYEPDTGKSRTTGNLMTARIDHTATLLPDGKVLVAGGFTIVFSQPLRNNIFLNSAAPSFMTRTRGPGKRQANSTGLAPDTRRRCSKTARS